MAIVIERIWHAPCLGIYVSHHYMVLIQMLSLHVLERVEIAIISVDVSTS